MKQPSRITGAWYVPYDSLFNSYANAAQLTRVLLNLFVNSLIPPFPSQLGNELDIPPIPLQTPSQIIDRDERANESGLFQAFTSYLSSYAADDPPEPSDEELENTLSTVDCINACSIETVLANIL
jgi:golgi-specific brefeldin A-resistance guanine nucleotide exchange factor 1